ncbi:uncharacterized protein LOC122660377 isoform X1 [Telopea speciosissima]|uniref:uncharacterized protein LOC122660377 isoform X1 n=1 Tax=Telopea speciosissima TaxID=54955 RepID=UPI001CC50288|nr:uncharacterized protein LOC122660377 isoform X1 [Telopea speciosissima]
MIQTLICLDKGKVRSEQSKHKLTSMNCRVLTPNLSTTPHHFLSLCRNPSLNRTSHLRTSVFFSPPLWSNVPRIISSVRSGSTPNACSLELPLLPFKLDEVLVPSESKTLHLYEARYLALLEESWVRKRLFVHFVLDPILSDGSSAVESFAARYGCLVHIENVERLDIGALVSIRGIGRVRIVNFLQAEPYLTGIVVPKHDNFEDYDSDINFEVLQLKEALYSLNSLQIKLKASKDELLQTHIINSLRWAEKQPSIDCDEAFFPLLPERMSFVAFQPVSGSSESELGALQRDKLRAMEIKVTSERLENSIKLVKQNISVVAAKLAIQSLEMQ